MKELSKAATWHVVGEEGAAQRVDNYLTRLLKGVPKSHIYRILRSGEVRVNSGRVGPEHRLKAGDYFARLAYLERNQANTDQLQALRVAVRDSKRVATCLGFGPRYLHSTGQAYKGGPNSGVFLILTRTPAEDLPLPGQKLTFGQVQLAQALGDFQAPGAEKALLKQLSYKTAAPEQTLYARMAAASTLGKMRSAEGRKALEGMLEEPEPLAAGARVSPSTAFVLGYRNLARAIPLFVLAFAVDARDADIEPRLQEEGTVDELQIDLGIDRRNGRKLDLPLGGGELQRTDVAGRPGGREQLLGGRVRLRQLDVEVAIAAARGAVAATRGVGLAGEENLLAHGGFPFHCSIIVSD